MRIEQAIAIEPDKVRDEPAERGMGARMDRRVEDAEGFRQIMRAQRELRHDAEAAAAASLQSPEEFAVRAGVGDARDAVGGDDLGLQQ
jgi:hypothetical protein